jgi:hypothetical protein
MERKYVSILLGIAAVYCYSLTTVLTGQPSGSVFYADSQNGNDRNDGKSADKAWKSLDKVNTYIFRPGDTLLLKCGSTFTGQFSPKGSGKEMAPVVISSFGKGEKPKIMGNGQVQSAVYLHNTEYWEISGLDISNAGDERKAERTGVKIYISDFGTAHSIHLRNLDIHDVNGSLVKEEGGGAGISVQNKGEKIISAFDGLLIEDCAIKRCERNGISSSGYWMRQNWHPNLHVVIRRNILEEIPGDGIVLIACDGAIVEHNIISNGSRLLPENESAAGIWPWSCDNTLVQFNEVSGQKAPWDGQGFDSDWNCRNTIIQYNYSHDNEGGFLLVCNDGSTHPPFSAGNTGTIVRYNVSINDGIRPHRTRSGMFSPTIHFAGPVKNTRIYHNFIYAPKKQTDSIDNTIISMTSWNGFADSTFFVSNIFCTEDTSRLNLGESTNHMFRHNVYYGPKPNIPKDISYVLVETGNNRETPGDMGIADIIKEVILNSNSSCTDVGMLIHNTCRNDFLGYTIWALLQTIKY